jgi:leader peptidase (prepilin peptidase)/N-methyltransferase
MIDVFIFIVGLVFGSFLNMLIFRLPEQISLFNPKRSICPNCEYQIRWYENIPIFSYLFLKGRCGNCKEKISIIYPIVEIITGIVTLLVVQKYGLNLDSLIMIFLTYTLILLSFIDLKYKAVPDYLLVIVLVLTFVFSSVSFKNLLIFAGGAILLEFFVTFYIQNIKSKILKDESLKEQKALGEGDIPIFAMIGGILGIKLGVIAIFLSAVFAIIPAIFNSYIKKDMETPFIPFLALGFFSVLIFEELILEVLRNLGL